MLLTTENLSIGYSAQKPVAANLSLSLAKGQMTSLLGPNGVGKSTLLRTIAGLQAPLSGSVTVCGELLSAISVSELSRRIALVLTDKVSAGGLTVFELVSMGRQPYTGFFGRLSDSDRAIIDQSMIEVGITDKADRHVAELSDGERQKVMIAKALAQQTPIIILDEPTAFLDAAARIDVMRLLHRLAAESQKAILLSTHDIDVATQLSDNLWLMNGNGLSCGTVAEIVGSGLLDNLFKDSDLRFDTTARRFVW
jgi:iron complex transport system ATP-binding protein